MADTQVQQILGRPIQKEKFDNEAGPTPVYDVAGVPGAWFEVDFGANGTAGSTDVRDNNLGV